MDIGYLVQQFGLPGLAYGAMGWVIVYLWRDNKSMTKQLFEVMEQRRVESVAITKELNQTLQTFSQSTQMLIDKIHVARGEKS